jgi:hypothetical protein
MLTFQILSRDCSDISIYIYTEYIKNNMVRNIFVLKTAKPLVVKRNSRGG